MLLFYAAYGEDSSADGECDQWDRYSHGPGVSPPDIPEIIPTHARQSKPQSK